MIVDDDEDDREMFCEAVERVSSSTRCLHAVNGLEALNILSTNPEKPDLIFLDLNMPKFGGKQCLAEIKKRHDINNIPVIIYSTSNLLEDKEETAQLGAAAYLHKPTSFDRLCRELSALLA
jgi:CheY-like chemotaxis protein